MVEKAFKPSNFYFFYLQKSSSKKQLKTRKKGSRDSGPRWVGNFVISQTFRTWTTWSDSTRGIRDKRTYVLNCTKE